MTNPILLKHSTVAGVVPTAVALAVRELALNTADGRLFTKTSAGTVVEFAKAADRGSWTTSRAMENVTGQLAWKNYGNGHTVIDASGSTAPNGAAISNTNAQNAWAASFPTLMGWNGVNTYGVRVDSARTADTAVSTSGNAGSATVLQTGRTINGSSFDGSASIETTEWFHSARDFPSGTLVETSINYAVTDGDPWVLEIKGNSYGNAVPLDLQYQGYIYSNTIINHGGYSNGFSISGMVLFNFNGKLCFWWPSQGYWQGYNVRAYVAHATRAVNRVVSISGAAKPAVVTKEVAMSANIRQSWRSDNLTNLNQLSNGPGYTTNTGTVTGVTATAPVASSGGTAPVISMAAATASANGYMTSAYAGKLDGIAAGANAYSLPIATAGVLGGIRVGAGLTIDGSGILASVGGSDAPLLISTNTTAVAGSSYVLMAALTLTLPATPPVGSVILFQNASGAACTVARNGQPIMTLAEDLTLDLSYTSGKLVYTGVVQGWLVTDMSATQVVPTTPTNYDPTFTRITNPGGGVWSHGNTSVTGALAIQLPVGMVSSMLRVTLKIYEYTTGESFEVHCGGYTYSTGSTWANNPTAYIIGDPGTNRNFTVRFGYTSTGKAIIYVGELASVWSCPQVFVTEVQVGYGGQSVSYTTGWVISAATSFQNVTATISNVQVGQLSTTTPAAAGTAAVGTSTTVARSDHVHALPSSLVGFTNSNSANLIAGADALTNNGIGYVNAVSLLGQIDGALYAQAYSTSYVHQVFGDYRTGQIAVRGKNNGAWQAWRTVLDSTNYTSYAPTKTGTGASGSWAISVTGSAASITGVYGGTLTSAQVTTALGYTPSNPGGLTVAIASSSITATAGTTYVLTASLTLTLPASPSAGAMVSVSNRSGVDTCVVARNAQKIMGLVEDMTLDTNGSASFVFADATRGWVLL